MPSYLTEAGLSAPTAADLLEIIRADYESRVGVTVGWERDKVLGNLTAIMAVRLGDICEALQAVYDAFDRATAAGVSLDAIGALVGVPRLPATYSTVTLRLTGVDGTVVPAGRIYEGGGTDGKAQWQTIADVTMAGTTENVEARAMVIGAVSATIGQIDAIVTPLDGITAVTNLADADTGDEIETDTAYRLRQVQSLQNNAGTSLNSLKAELLLLDGVVAVLVQDYDLEDTLTVNGILMYPHSLAVVVFPSTLSTAQQKKVAETIYAHAPDGIRTIGTVSTTVTGGDGTTKTIRWTWAAAVAVAIVATATLASGYVLNDVTAAIQAAIIAYFNALMPGSAARKWEIEAAVSAHFKANNILGLTRVTVTLNGGTADIVPLASQIATLTPTPPSVV